MRSLSQLIHGVKKVVDVRSDSAIYYDINDYNEVDSVGKTILIVVVIIMWIVVTGISVFRIYFGIFQDGWLFD